MILLSDPRDAYAEAVQEDRCGERIILNIPAQLRPSGMHAFPVKVCDISISGFSCEAVTGMRAGERCWLTLPGLASQQAEVVWNNGQLIGCAFANLLSPAVLSRVVARFR
jgi:hypothetical protein